MKEKQIGALRHGPVHLIRALAREVVVHPWPALTMEGDGPSVRGHGTDMDFTFKKWKSRMKCKIRYPVWSNCINHRRIILASRKYPSKSVGIKRPIGLWAQPWDWPAKGFKQSWYVVSFFFLQQLKESRCSSSMLDLNYQWNFDRKCRNKSNNSASITIWKTTDISIISFKVASFSFCLHLILKTLDLMVRGNHFLPALFQRPWKTKIVEKLILSACRRLSLSKVSNLRESDGI